MAEVEEGLLMGFPGAACMTCCDGFGRMSLKSSVGGNWPCESDILYRRNRSSTNVRLKKLMTRCGSIWRKRFASLEALYRLKAAALRRCWGPSERHG